MNILFPSFENIISFSFIISLLCKTEEFVEILVLVVERIDSFNFIVLIDGRSVIEKVLELNSIFCSEIDGMSLRFRIAL